MSKFRNLLEKTLEKFQNWKNNMSKWI